jgi:hypothetical protein
MYLQNLAKFVGGCRQNQETQKARHARMSVVAWAATVSN